uniref:Putative secreted protein n=1 Tax=Lutzomyia longipalpis TaxID=7200 RepID=A0A7G3AQ09_LUTLO
MKFSVGVTVFLTFTTFAFSLEILDQLKSSTVSFHQQIHSQVYSARSRLNVETENALPSELGLFELAVNDILKDLATIEETFNSVSTVCRDRMPTSPENVRNYTEVAFQSCAMDFFHELSDAQTASQGSTAFWYDTAVQQSLQVLEGISRKRITQTSESLTNTIEAVFQEFNQKRLHWDNVETTELFYEVDVYQDKVESVKRNIKSCLMNAQGKAGADIGDIFISLWDC